MVMTLTRGRKIRMPFWECGNCGYNEQATLGEYRLFRRVSIC